MSKRTFAETVEYFEWLAYEYEKDAARAADELEAAKAAATAEAYELAAFELTRNMEH